MKKWAGPSLLLTLLLVFYVWEGIQTGKLVREVGELRVTKTKLENRVQILSVHLDRLSSFDRIEKLARSQLGMTLPEGKVPVVRVPMDKEF
ncbi:cell division protein FtsL [candidate division KSB1 bacterium]|nr:cell division protein FtsL [candidate division KSB1 bacterium]